MVSHAPANAAKGDRQGNYAPTAPSDIVAPVDDHEVAAHPRADAAQFLDHVGTLLRCRRGPAATSRP